MKKRGHFSIRLKIFLALLLTAISAAVVIGVIGYQNSKASLEQASYNQLIALRETKKFAIENYFKEIKTEIVTLGESYMTIEAMKSFNEAYQQLPVKKDEAEHQNTTLQQYYENELVDRLKRNLVKTKTLNAYIQNTDATRHLQYNYIAHNRYPTGKKFSLLNSEACGQYDEVHTRFHQKFSNFINKFHFYDLFLIDIKTGSIVYTVMKEVDFATSLTTGPYQGSNLATAFHIAADELKEGQVKLVDFEMYDPSYGAPASFVTTPIYENGVKVGVLALQVSIDEIDAIMTGDKKWREAGLGNSGETYLVGNDFRMRSNSRFLFEDKQLFLNDLRKYNIKEDKISYVDKLNTTILTIDVATKGTQEVQSGHTGIMIINDYRNIPVLSAFAPINIEGVKWAILCEIDEEEAFTPIRELLYKYLFIIGLISVGVFFLAFSVTRMITKPVLRIRNALSVLATGELPKESIPIETNDEIGQMKEATNDLIFGLKNAVDFARKIEIGDFDASFKPLSERDSVGNALLNMRNGLKIATELQQQALEEALAQEEELRQNSEELFALNDELNLKQKDLMDTLEALKESEAGLELKVAERTHELSIKNTLMTDSIQYAKNIQVAMLPTAGQLKKAMSEYFIIYRPKDIVSGDFYWLSAHRNKLLIVCADCTGHGVPGAFMSIVGINTFNQIIREYGINLTPDLILNEVNQRICALLKQGYSAGEENERQYDGMDVAFCMVDYKEGKIHFAGAGRPLYYFTGGELKCVKGDKLPIGGSSLFYPDVTFTEHVIDVEKGDTIYMYSDGFPDQFNKEDRKKFGAKRVEQLIGSVQDLDLTEQGLVIERSIDEWKGNTSQTDDVCIIGFKIT